jgi:hypothetical protein
MPAPYRMANPNFRNAETAHSWVVTSVESSSSSYATRQLDRRRGARNMPARPMKRAAGCGATRRLNRKVEQTSGEDGLPGSFGLAQALDGTAYDLLVPHFGRGSRPVRATQQGKNGPYLPKLHSAPVGSEASDERHVDREWHNCQSGNLYRSHRSPPASVAERTMQELVYRVRTTMPRRTPAAPNILIALFDDAGPALPITNEPKQNFLCSKTPFCSHSGRGCPTIAGLLSP